jgi:mannosyltransferase OCH1-like enzyme
MRPAAQIPPVLHYVWVGDRPLPARYQDNIASWRETNPGFRIRAWTNETVRPDHPYLERSLADGNWANASNYLRLAVVLAHGGIYLDTDVMLIGSLRPMLRRSCFFGFQTEAQEKDWVNNAVFGAVPGHGFVRACLDRLTAEFDGTEAANHSAPRLLTRLLVERGLRRYRKRGVLVEDVFVYPRPVFYPYRWDEAFSLDAVTRSTRAVHFWDKTWRRPGEVEPVPPPDDAETAQHQAALRALAQARKRRRSAAPG